MQFNPTGAAAVDLDESMSFRPSAIEAYRSGLPNGEWVTPSTLVAGCISIATVLAAAAEDEPTVARAEGLERAAVLAEELLGRDAIHLGCYNDPLGLNGPVDKLRLLVESVERADGYSPQLAEHLLDSLAALHPLHSLAGGRILAHRMRTVALDGDESLATERARMLVRVGHRLASDELQFRGWTGLAGLSQMRGNFPQAGRLREHALRFAQRTGEPRLISMALHGKAGFLGARGEHAAGVELSWQALTLSDHPHARRMILSHLAEAMYRTGHFAASRAARARVLQDPAHRSTMFIDLGGYAVSCAALEDLPGVTWASQQLVRLAQDQSGSRGLAQGLLGCAAAYGQLGLDDLARPFYVRAIEMSDRHGYHDLRFTPDPTMRVAGKVTTRRLTGTADAVRQLITELAPNGVPADLALVPT